MKLVVGLTVVFLMIVQLSARTFKTYLQTSYPQRKTWWAHYVRYPAFQRAFFTNGRLTTRQIKYAAENGFRAIVSVPNFLEGIDFQNGERYPTTAEEGDLARELGLEFEIVMPPGADWRTMEQVMNMKRALGNIKKRPVLVHCRTGLSAAFLFLAANIENCSMSSNAVYETGRKLGLDFYKVPQAREIISQLTKEPIPNREDAFNTPRLLFHDAKRFDNKFAVSGQFGGHNLKAIAEDGFKTIINFRGGLTNPNTGMSSQEEVTLLNVKDWTSRFGARQQKQLLEMNRLNPSLPTTYISKTSMTNYEMRNRAEFGDDVGYNENMERKAVEEAGFQYLHMPFGPTTSTPFGAATYRFFRKDIMAALERGPVLFHCSTGYKAVIMALLAYSEMNSMSAAQALNMARNMGWFHDPIRDIRAVRMFYDILP